MSNAFERIYALLITYRLTMVFFDINFVPGAIYLTQSDWLAFFSNQTLCVRKEELATRLSGHVSLLSFQTQQEQTVFMLEAGKTVATVRKKNIQAEVKKRKIRINCQQKRCSICGGGGLKRGLTAPTSNPPSCQGHITRWCPRENRHTN